MLHLATERAATPLLDTALSAAVVQAVAAGWPDTLRLWTPERSVAFGRQDRVRPGYRQAVHAATAAGFDPVERLAGGRAAVFHEGTVAFSWAMADPDPRRTIQKRFGLIAGIVVEALRYLGADARVGEVPGEYCPGSWSVNLGGTRKVMGVGQRLIRGAAHLGGVIVVTDPDLVNLPLVPVYAALDYGWRPEATGAVADQVAGIDPGRVMAALLAAFAAAGHPTEPHALPPDIVAAADRLAGEHAPIA